MNDTKLPPEGIYLTPSEYAERAHITEEEVWRRLEDGRLPAVALADWQHPSGKGFDYVAIVPEAVRRIVAGFEVEHRGHGRISILQGKMELIRVLVSPELTPEVYPQGMGKVTTKKTGKPTEEGVPKNEIIEHFRLPSAWEDKLAHVDDYACLSSPVLARRGRPGKGGSSIFNPAEFGAMLIRERATNLTGHQFNVTMVNVIIQQHFKSWIDEWDECRNGDFSSGLK